MCNQYCHHKYHRHSLSFKKHFLKSSTWFLVLLKKTWDISLMRMHQDSKPPSVKRQDLLPLSHSLRTWMIHKICLATLSWKWCVQTMVLLRSNRFLKAQSHNLNSSIRHSANITAWFKMDLILNLKNKCNLPNLPTYVKWAFKSQTAI